MKHLVALATVAACALAPAAAHARSPQDAGGWYLGMTVGSANVGDMPDVVPLVGGPSGPFVTDGRDPGVKAVIGYRLHRHFAIEGGYAWLGQYQFSNQPNGPTGGALTADTRVIGLFVDAVGLMPIGWGFTALAKIGVVGSEVRTTRTVTGGVTPAPGLTTTSYADAADLKIGLGLQYDLGARASVRIEWERYPDIGTASTGVVDLDVYSVGVMLRF